MTTKYTKNFGLAMPDFRQGAWHDLINDDLEKLDNLIYGAMSQGNVEPWAHSTVYTIGMTVLDGDDASVWMCAINHTSAATGTFAQDRAAHPTYWARLLTGFSPRGEWAQSTQYFPYDLTYDSAHGIMALCTVQHISTATGTIIDDKVNWAFLLDMSDVDTVTAISVTYSNVVSGIPKTNVQDAIDYVETQIHAVDNINITQGNRLTALESADVSLDSRLDAVEAKATTSYSAPFYIATQNVSTQFGGDASIGYYSNASATAIRAYGTTPIYFQAGGAAQTYGYINNTGMNITGTLTAGGQISGSTLSAPVIVATQYLEMRGWSGNPGMSLMFLNGAHSSYMYFDGSSVSFAGVSQVIAGNGRLWGANDTLPTPAAIMTGMRLSSGSWDYSFGSSGMVEPGGGLIVTGNGFTAGIGYQFRVRYLQYLYNGSWYTVGYG